MTAKKCREAQVEWGWRYDMQRDLAKPGATQTDVADKF